MIEVNETLQDAPETVNGSPYDDGWMLKVKILDRAQLSGLLSPEAYERHIAG